MKFKIDKAEIISEFQSLAAVADKKQTLPILSNILIRCEADSIKLLSTDLEVELEVCLSGANIEQPGETTIPAKKAADIFDCQNNCEGLLLLNHGHFTWGNSAKESYDRVIRHTNKVEKWINKNLQKQHYVSSKIKTLSCNQLNLLTKILLT